MSWDEVSLTLSGSIRGVSRLDIQHSFDVSDFALFTFLSDLQTGPPNPRVMTENAAIIAGVVAALVLLVALTLLAVYYINTHPTVAPPFFLMQVREKNKFLQSADSCCF